MTDKQYKDAWHQLKEEKIKRYKKLRKKYYENYGFYYIAQPLSLALSNLAMDIKRMDKLDGTNEFSNLLIDLEDE